MKMNDIKLSLYKYKVKSMIINIDKDTKYTVDNNLILGFNISEIFEKFYFPFFTIDIGLPNDIYRKLQNPKNKNSLKINLHIQKGKFTEALSIDPNTNVSWKDYIKGSFHAVVGKDNPELSERMQKEVERSENSYGQITVVALSLYNSSYYDNYDVVVNTNLENVTAVEALTLVLNKAKINKVLLSPPSNYKTYKQFPIVPIKLFQQIDRITNTYAMHKKGTLIYFGLDRLYIVEKTPKCTAFEKNESKITYITSATEGNAVKFTGGSYTNTKDNFNVLNATNVKFDNTTSVTKKTIGENTVSVNVNTGSITKTNKKATKITNVVIQNEGNDTTSALNRAVNETKKILDCGFIDCDISTLTVNKQFVVSIEGSAYKKYNGKYRIVLADYSFIKEGNYFSVNARAEFKGE